MASTFTSFPKFPTEIRLRIWHHSLQLFGRVIEVDPGEDQHSPGTPFTRMPFRISLSLQNTILPPADTRSNYNNLLVNFSIDILYIKLKSVNVSLPPLPRDRIKPLFKKLFSENADEVTGQLESLACNSAFWDAYEDVTLWPQPFLREFAKLREMARVGNVPPCVPRNPTYREKPQVLWL
ncbi:hypothetical protein IFR05_006797 [Cadophora sp. M221]|nr:hypothetical protein IFR05_006797 [Cadophora sp. M221]